MKGISTFLYVFFLVPLISLGNSIEDTITIDLGNNNKIIILVSGEDDLKDLQQYDINKMLKDLQLSIDSVDASHSELTIEDTSGNYLKSDELPKDLAELEFEPGGYYRKININGVESVNVGNNFEALVKRSNSYKMTISGKEMDVDEVHYQLKGKHLELGYRTNTTNRKQRVKILIEIPELYHIKASGAAKVNVVGFDSDNFHAEASGAAKLQMAFVSNDASINAGGASNVKLFGKTDRLKLDASGASEIDASTFNSGFTQVNSSGASKIWINSQQVESKVSGAGRVINRNKSDSSEPQSITTRNSFRVKIGKYEFSVPTDDWDNFERRIGDVESLSDLENRIDKYEYVQKDIPPVRHSMNFEFGMNNYLEKGSFPDIDGELYTVKPWGSWMVGINSIHKFHLAGPLFLDWGKGVSWYNFKFENPDVRVLKGDHGVLFEPDAREFASVKSKITISHINMSFVPLLDFGQGLRKVKSYSLEGMRFTQYHKRGFRIGAGPYAGYRIGSHTKYVYKDDRKEREKDRGNFFLNSWRYGIRGQIGYKALDLFFNYDLSPLYVGKDSPELQPFSFGIIF